MISTHDNYNSEVGDSRPCICGHTYISHFSNIKPHPITGCKHCICGRFVEIVVINNSVNSEV